MHAMLNAAILVICLVLRIADASSFSSIASCVRTKNSCHGHAELLQEKFRYRFPEGLATPFMVDWDGDGDQDLFVGHRDGSVSYYQQEDGGLVLRSVEVSTVNMDIPPYDEAKGGYSSAAPVALDWDLDGQLELIVASGGKVRYFTREHAKLVEQLGEQNPFDVVQLGWVVGRLSVADWDGDGDLDLIASHGRSLDYYEQIDGRLVLQSGSHNPFTHVQGQLIADARGWDGTYGAPHAVDWDDDGDMDLILGQSDGKLWYYERMANAHLSRRAGDANPFEEIRNGYYVSAQTFRSRNQLYFVAGYQDGTVVMYQRYMDVRVREREFSMNPFFEIGQLKNAVPAVQMEDSSGAQYFMFQTTNVGSVETFKRHPDGRFQNVTFDLTQMAPAEIWQPADTPQYVDWNHDGLIEKLTLFHNGTLLYEEAVNGSYVEVQSSQNPFAGLTFHNHFADSNVSGFLALDLNGDGRMGLLVAEWGLSYLRYFETGWCELAEPCKSRGVCGMNGACDCFAGFSANDCSSCSAGFFTEMDLEDGALCKPCPGKDSSNGTCSSRGWCFDDAKASLEAKAINMSKPQRDFLHGDGQCNCHDFFFGSNCEGGSCPPGFQLDEGESGVQCLECPAGFFKAEHGNEEKCGVCPEHSYADTPGLSHCSSCEGFFFAWNTNEARTECFIDLLTSSLITLSAACWSLVFFVLPFLVGLPMVVSDVVSHLGGVRLIAHGGHGVLRNRSVLLSFKATGHPHLDPKGVQFKAVWLTFHELLLMNKDGSPLEDIETSSGTFQVQIRHALTRTGMFGLPYYSGLMLAMAYVGIFQIVVKDAYAWDVRTLLLHSGLGLAVGLVLHVLRSYALRRTRLLKDIRLFRRQLWEFNPRPVATDRGPMRAVTVGQLQHFYEFFKAYIGSNRNMHYIVYNIVRPLTQPAQLSYAEVAGASIVRWFVSHHWGSAFRHLVEAVRQHARAVSMPNPFLHERYWICSFSNNQWKVEEEIGETWEESSFYLAMRCQECQGTAMVFDDEAVTLTRSWCLFELLQTEHLSLERTGFHGLMICTSQGIMNHGGGSLDLAMNVTTRLTHLRLEDAQASKDEDKQMIDALVAQGGGFPKVNAFLIQTLKKALRVTQMRVRDDLESLKTTLSVAEKSCALKPRAKPSCEPSRSVRSIKRVRSNFSHKTPKSSSSGSNSNGSSNGSSNGTGSGSGSASASGSGSKSGRWKLTKWQIPSKKGKSPGSSSQTNSSTSNGNTRSGRFGRSSTTWSAFTFPESLPSDEAGEVQLPETEEVAQREESEATSGTPASTVSDAFYV